MAKGRHEKIEPLPGKPLVDEATRKLLNADLEAALAVWADDYDANPEMDLLLIKDLYGEGPDPAPKK